MPTFKLTYFDGRGRAQNIRLLMKLAGVEFEDHRIKHEEWEAFKPKTPFGAVPYLTIDGKELTEQKAIARYLAREFGYYGETSLECAEIDCVMDMVEDVYEGVTAIFMAQGDAEKMTAAVAEYKKGAKKMFTNLEKKFSQCNEGKEFFIGSKMTVADVFAYSAMDFATTITGGDESVLEEFTKLKALRSRVGENESIAAWVASRPKTQF